MTGSVAPAALREMLQDGGELALLDVREEGRFGRGHLFFAAPLPLSRLELRIRGLVPRLGTRIVLCDDGDGLAQRAADRLAGCGYGEVSVLAGGNPAWQAGGFRLFGGMNVPSKAFGEFVEHTCRTPSISAGELRGMMEAGRDLVILDSRPLEEYARMSIPGGVNVPGAELVYRAHDLAGGPETLVVVNCAGRTRSIIGAQSLINAGLRNEVVALRNGTMGWHLAGYPLEHGKSRRAPPPSAAGLRQAIDAAARVGERFGVRRIDHPTLERWRAERGERTLYLLDVRLPEDYAAGHVPDARNAPGGQLVQATDAFMATRNARVVLLDLHGVQATLTASWLIQMGWRDVSVLEAGLLPFGLATGPDRPDIPGLAEAAPPQVSPAELAGMLAVGEAAVLDLATSPVYRAGHIPGAWFAIRAELDAARARLPAARRWVLTSPDGVLARLAAADACAAGLGEVSVLRRGTDAWRAEGRPLSEGAEHLASEPEDFFPKPYDREQGVEKAMQDYLAWELELVSQVEAELPGLFQPFP